MRTVTNIIMVAIAIILGLSITPSPVHAQDVGVVVIQGQTSGFVNGDIYVTGQQYTLAFDGTISNPPSVGQECTLQGPTWTWSVFGTSGTTVSSGSHVSFTVTFASPGTYTISATGSVAYSSTGSNCGGPYSGTNSAFITITVVDCLCPVISVRHKSRAL